MPRYYVGTSGWVYRHWRGTFYPCDLAQSKWLDYYSCYFPTVELNNSFYRLPSEKTFSNWKENSPQGFIYAVKVSRFVTHIKRLKDVDEAITTFVSRAGLLEEKLGPLLYQLPPSMHRDDDRLDAFLSTLPNGIRHVVEFRHESWLDERVFDILRSHNIGLCVFDMPQISCPLLTTADFAYVRFHGSSSLYSSCYTDGELEYWAKEIMRLAKHLDAVYIYFNNDAEGFAISNARKLMDRLGLPKPAV